MPRISRICPEPVHKVPNLPSDQQVAVGTTVVSPLTRKGDPRPKADWKNGVALEEARKDKERRYPELLLGNRCKLVVTAMEVGGRWSEEAYHFLDTLAEARARDAPKALKGSVHQACKRRWIALVSVAGMRSLANSFLLEDGQTGEVHESFCLPLVGYFARSVTKERFPTRACPCVGELRLWTTCLF